MVQFDKQVRTQLAAYAEFLFTSNYCSIERAQEKYLNIVAHLRTLDRPLCIDRPSTHPSFGGKEGYLLSRYTDRQAGTQWAFTYERYEDAAGIFVIVHEMRLSTNITD